MSMKRDDLHRELHAALGARRELSDEDEHFLIENFLQKIQSDMDAHIDARIAQHNSKTPLARRSPMSVVALAVVLVLAIPLLAIAGNAAGTAGVVAIAIAILGALFLTTR